MLDTRKWCLFVLICLVGVPLFAQEATLPDRSLPYGSDSQVDNPAIERLAAESAVADAVAKARKLELENLRLKIAMQRLQISLVERIRDPGSNRAQDRAFPLRRAIWPSATIPVTWENPSPANAQERQWVQDAITRTWQAESGLKFTGWGQSQASSTGIRILIADDGPHVKALGRGLDGMRNGMVLNFTFGNWCPACGGANRRSSIESIAVHEFGHAISFAHEQNRSDAPLWCQRERQGSDGDWFITVYDPDSIMNYCNPLYNNNGDLSPLDIAGARALYGAPGNPVPTPVPNPVPTPDVQPDPPVQKGN
ncbi:Astacin (Peptidase family M12A) [Rubripirellula lacrimiformis]|uniref:Astacin (Peptidase family M12A) n=1 Tax=Rubripirellula lacrimiformis TaxID=1930273 RepID=A0A517N7J0_9BACT|nr:hypothetical protein [Rubripirellula lacrimiformis]QDT03105.1 Astacin (Peptidase family M12A) [Rubripirellula lacrimiformis]